MEDLIVSSEIENKYTSTGRHSGYQVNLYHSGLDEHKHLSAVDHSALLGKIHNQQNTWQAKWEKEQKIEQSMSKERKAKLQTEKAQLKLEKTENILKHTLSVDDRIDWDSLKHNDGFRADFASEKRDYIQYRLRDHYPESVLLIGEQSLPSKSDFKPQITLWDNLFGRKASIEKEHQDLYQKAVESIQKQNEKTAQDNAERETVLKAQQNHWEQEKAAFEESQRQHNERVEELKVGYEQKNPDSIVEYCEMVLNNSEYLENFPKHFSLQYNEVNGMLLVDYQLPSLNEIPSINNLRYVKSRDETETKYLSNAAHTKLYDSAIYQIALRTLHELFEADTVDALKAVNFNGFVTATNPSTGHKETSCIISVQAQKEPFEAINLKGIVAAQSYKECFKSLKGVGSAKLSTMTAVKPLIEMNKSDKRFRDHYEVADGLNEEINIAAMDWEDFEHLVRELFEKEFTENGGEVRVTQASSDGGVDAIAFDPDPIRGGKIVIQAKRYTNTVGVAAVRDLFGTVMNEGANKGILVTTSDYGSDSYDFAKDKPITLLNGSNLLHLLEKHGHRAKIDIKEAKRMMKDKAA